MCGICHLLKEIKDIIRMNLLPSLTGRPPLLNDIERDLLSLPAQLGGIGIVNPSNYSKYYPLHKQIPPRPSQNSIRTNRMSKDRYRMVKGYSKRRSRCPHQPLHSDPLNWPRKKVHPCGSLQYHFVSMGSISTRVPSGMQLHFVMVGRLQTYQHPVYVAPVSQSSTLSPAQGCFPNHSS